MPALRFIGMRLMAEVDSATEKPRPSSEAIAQQKKPPRKIRDGFRATGVANQLVIEGNNLDEGSGSPCNALDRSQPGSAFQTLRASSARQWRNAFLRSGRSRLAQVQRRPSLVSLAMTYSPAS